MRGVCAALLALWAGWVAWAAAETSGKELFERRCTGCHAVDRDKEGPRLGGVYRRKAGSVNGFGYSEALRKSGVVWDGATLDKWLTNPDSVAKDNDMPFRVPDARERDAIIQYLKHL